MNKTHNRYCKLGFHSWSKSGYTPNGWVKNSDGNIRHCVYCDLTQCYDRGRWRTIPKVPLPPLPKFETRAKLVMNLQGIIKKMSRRLKTMEELLYEFHCNTCEKCGHKISKVTFFEPEKLKGNKNGYKRTTASSK